MKRKLESLVYCKECLLPNSYPGIRFNSNGVCRYCEQWTRPNYLGKDKLLDTIATALKKNACTDYDCVVGYSGGRDSTYLLYYIVRELKLRPLAVFVDDQFIPEQAFENMKETTRILGVALLIRQSDYLKRCVTHHIHAWLKRPVAESLMCINVGERLGYLTMVEEEAVRRGIKLTFQGGSPFQQEAYKSDIVKLRRQGGAVALVCGWTKQVLLNPSLVMNYTALKTQYAEFTNKRRTKKVLEKNSIMRINPYNGYVRWVERDIEDVLLNVLNWKRVPGMESTARVSCEIDTLRQYLFLRTLGYNDRNVTLSEMIRDGQLSRKEALIKLQKERHIPRQIIAEIVGKAGVESTYFFERLDKRYATI